MATKAEIEALKSLIYEITGCKHILTSTSITIKDNDYPEECVKIEEDNGNIGRSGSTKYEGFRLEKIR